LETKGFVADAEWCTLGEANYWASKLLDLAAGREVVKNPHLRLPDLLTFLTSAAMRTLVQPLLGPLLAIENVFVMVKYPDTEFAVPWHQDGINDLVELDPIRSVAVWIALTAATHQSGCLEVIPGSHQDGYRKPSEDETAGSPTRGTPLSTSISGLPSDHTFLELEPGRACLLDMRTIHRSATNRSAQPRVGVNIRYVGPGAYRYAADDKEEPAPATKGWTHGLARSRVGLREE
jgi:ectoine hydroxylase-related dioxygenase (phytanoyl-CoA dioxygenase family)